MPEGLALSALKRVVVGKPIPSHLAHHERLSKTTGLAILSSDALSSVAYATEEILRTLLIAGSASLWLVTPIGAVITALLLVIAFSYRQTIHAYPGGGGAYVVARENIGVNAGLVAAAALLTDYILTVAVSIAAGVAAVTSALPNLHVNRVEMSLLFLGLLAIGNLRGIRESGRIFAAPTYFFILSILSLLAVGFFKLLTGPASPLEAGDSPVNPTQAGALTTFLVLRAFSNGCTALTGVEAISTGVPAFEPPEEKNAAQTLLVMAVLAATMFMGITVLAHAFGVIPQTDETVISMLARAVFGGRGLPYYLVQAATMLILVLAANTAYSAFPRLASILARDRFLPRQFMNQGDRLAFSNGIVVLSLFAGVLLVVFGGDAHALIPLYMIGVFISFTLSQAGMVMKWKREGGEGSPAQAALNAFGALLTTVVLVFVTMTKFTEGAWMIVAVIPVLVWHFHSIRRHYAMVALQLSLKRWRPQPPRRNIVIVPIGGVHRAVVEALDYARSIATDVRAIYVDVEAKATEAVRRDWIEWGDGAELVTLESPYRSLLEPLLEYIEQVETARPNDFITVLLPEFIPKRLWHHLLHNQQALLIKGALLFRPNVVVTSVPFHLRR